MMLSSDFIALGIIASALLIIFILIAIASLIEEVIVSKRINFKSWKIRFYTWLSKLL